MPNNPYLIPKTEEVREIPTYQPKYTDEEVAKLKEIFIAEQKEAIKKYQIKTSPLSPEARSKVIRKWGSDYASENREGHGPCRNTSCGCFCSKTECDCKNPEFSIYKEGSRKIGNATASGGAGLGSNALSGEVDFTLFRDSRNNGDLKVGTVSAGVDLVSGGFGGTVRASANVASFKTDGVEIKAGLNLDTGGSISANGLEIKVAGFGVSIGEKLEVSTIAGGVSCVIQ